MIFRKIILVSLAVISIFAGAHAAPIDEVLPFAGEEWDEVSEIGDLPQANLRDEFLPIVARFLIYGMAFAGFVIFLVAGAWLVLGWGEEESTKKARRAMIWAVVGLAFAAVSYLLVKGVVDLDFGWGGGSGGGETTEGTTINPEDEDPEQVDNETFLE